MFQFYFYILLLYRKLPISPIKVNIDYTKNYISNGLIRKTLTNFFGSSTTFIDNRKQSDIIISDCFERELCEKEKYFYFENMYDWETWNDLTKNTKDYVQQIISISF